jgi:hypothetical protein
LANTEGDAGRSYVQVQEIEVVESGGGSLGGLGGKFGVYQPL